VLLHPCPKKRPTLSFAVTATCLHQNGQHLAHKKKKLGAINTHSLVVLKYYLI